MDVLVLKSLTASTLTGHNTVGACIYKISGRGRKSSEHKYMHNFRAGQKKCGCKYTHCLGSLEYLIYKMCINKTTKIFSADTKFGWTTLPISPGASQRIKADPQCELNKIQEPANSTPLYQVFEEYATDQDAWIRQYLPAHEKMISNGYYE